MNVLIIAEAGINHNGNLQTALNMVVEAKRAGADIIKFQSHMPDHQMLKYTPTADYVKTNIYELLKSVELSEKEHKILKQYCDTYGIEFMSTPYCIEAVDMLERVGVKRYKIGSGEMTNFPLIERIFKTNKPIIISLGMSNFIMIADTLTFLNVLEHKYGKRNITLMHCVSTYPSAYDTINLNFLTSLQTFKQFKLGISDHSDSIYPSIAAIPLGAVVIEKHFTLDKNQEGPDHKASIEPDKLKELVKATRIVEKSLIGGAKVILDQERQVANMARHSLVTLKPIKKGDKLTSKNIGTKRPGTGIPANKFYFYLGKHAKKNIKLDEMIKEGDVV